MFYSENHVEVSLDAVLASEEYAKESIKDLKLKQGSVFDKNATGFTRVPVVNSLYELTKITID